MKANFVVANILAGVLGHDCAGADVSQCETTMDFIRAQAKATRMYYDEHFSGPGGTGAWKATIYRGNIESPVVTHRTGSGRLEVTLTSETLTLRINAGVKNDEGSYGCPVLTLSFEMEHWYLNQCDPQLVEGRYDRLALIAELDGLLLKAELPSVYVSLASQLNKPYGKPYGADIVISALDHLGDLRDKHEADESAVYDDWCASQYAFHVEKAMEAAS